MPETPAEAPVEVISTTTISLGGQWVNPPIVEEVAFTPAPNADGEISFDSYCNHKRIPADHRKGMRYFSSLKAATVAVWDQVFAAY
jgi:hypothetical protein